MRAQRPITSTLAICSLAFLSLLSTGEHTVERGETLAGIAARHDTTVAALVEANGLTDPDLIHEGERLVIPGSASAYEVREGDTLGRIASRHGTSISELLDLNSLRNPNLIRPGQVLAVPVGGSGGGGSTSAVATPAGGATTHVVQAGETIAEIASRYGVPQEQLVAANGLTDGRVYVGQGLRLAPAPGTQTTSDGGASSYEVREGDTLLAIALRLGTTQTALQEANGITDADRLSVGSTLSVPGGGGGSALRCPVQGGAQLMNDWGFPRSGGRFHEGNDLFAARGTPAVAVVSGTAEHTTGRMGGNQVKLHGDDGVSYYYTHLDGFGASGRVAAGDVIGYVGATGNAAGGPPHVHFEVHPGGGEAVNPYPSLSGVC